MNYFDIFSLQIEYNIDKTVLDTQYFALQQIYHPDRKQDKKDINIIDINKGYKILKDDLLRAEYLLSLRSIDIALDKWKDTIPEHELAEILNNFEYIDSLTDITRLLSELNTQQQHKTELISIITSLFNSNDYVKIVYYVLKLKYITNLIGKIKQKCK